MVVTGIYGGVHDMYDCWKVSSVPIIISSSKKNMLERIDMMLMMHLNTLHKLFWRTIYPVSVSWK